jgi:5-oxoprolinase (ATP-hydrolysing) subunit C
MPPGSRRRLFPFEVRFEAEHAFARTGADCAATLDRTPLLPWASCVAKAGQVLRLGLPHGGRWRGARAYLTLRGGIDVPTVLGSRSTQLRGAFGGLDGRMLRQGDRLAVGGAAAGAVVAGVVPPGLVLPLDIGGLPGVRVLRAAEYDAFTDTSLASFWTEPWNYAAE